MSRNENPLPKLIPKIVNFLLTLLFIYGCWYTWQMYKVYEMGYQLGLQHGAYLRKQAVEHNWRSQSFMHEKTNFVNQYGPRSTKTWRDQLYRQGWMMAVDKATEDIPH